VTSGDTAPTGIVVVVHGGQSVSTQPTSPVQLAMLRMIPVARAIEHELQGSGALVDRPRLAVRGWNGDLASPVPALNKILDDLGRQHGPVPVVLIGHSMGGRAVLRCAGHPRVTAVAGLAPWLPAGEPVAQLAGRRVLLVHGTADRITDPRETWAYAERARAVTEVTTLEVPGGDHPMLRQAGRWHQVAAEFARTSLRREPFTVSHF
jgi:alpha-beta hydrolase superfamily lysophospholipase